MPGETPETTPHKPVSEESIEGVLTALGHRFVNEMHFRNILAIAMVFTMCFKELSGMEVLDNFYLLVGIVIGMYFKQLGK